eukprot:CAMPEP_0172212380 /NCGR_PEP_ID=MMETSP1050-20130122/36975_1 /TAXON_ID=233186 /ORGANISM="Cryptomonas curvata, Strain CCAP979/52" /LENGTH=36 /DNA_ID= /DNA_START= /DNA_END= /DNA_ORIENTATION=
MTWCTDSELVPAILGNSMRSRRPQSTSRRAQLVLAS